MFIEIDGIGDVEVDDEFANLTPAEQNAFVEQIRSQVEAGSVSSDAPAEAQPVEKQRLRSVAQGLTLGFADELEAAIRNPLSALGSALGLSEGQDYKERLDIVRKKLESYRTENPLEAMAYEMGGAVLPAVAGGVLTAGTGTAAVGASTAARLAPTLARAAKVGAVEGGIAGFGAGEGGFTERAKTAATGAALGGTLGAAVPVAGQKIGQVGRRAMDALGVGGEKRAQTFSQRKMLEALEREGMTPRDAMRRLDEARRLGVEDITPADLGENLRGAAWRAQATPSAGRQGVFEQFAERQAGQAEQISSRASEMAGVQGDTGLAYLDDLAQKVEAEARPAYRAAYEVELNAAPFQSMAKSKVVKDAYSKAVELADIDPDIDISSMPKDLSKFFDEQMVPGQRVFMPTEVAHNIKKGLDVLIDSETDTLTGKVTPRGRALTKLKNSWNAEIVNQNDAYKVANAQFADKAKMKRAYDIGFDFNKTPEERLAKSVGAMTRAEKQSLRVGLISQVEELASKTGDATDFVKTIFGTPRRRAALRLAFDDANQFDRFERMMKIQADKMRTQRKVFGGSDTAEKLMQGRDADIDASSVFSVGSQLGMGNIPGAAMAAGSQIASRLQGMNEKSATAMSRMLFEPDAAKQRQMFGGLLGQQEIDEAMRRRMIQRPEFYSGVIGGMSGLLAGGSE